MQVQSCRSCSSSCRLLSHGKPEGRHVRGVVPCRPVIQVCVSPPQKSRGNQCPTTGQAWRPRNSDPCHCARLRCARLMSPFFPCSAARTGHKPCSGRTRRRYCAYDTTMWPQYTALEPKSLLAGSWTVTVLVLLHEEQQSDTRAFSRRYRPRLRHVGTLGLQARRTAYHSSTLPLLVLRLVFFRWNGWVTPSPAQLSDAVHLRGWEMGAVGLSSHQTS